MVDYSGISNIPANDGPLADVSNEPSVYLEIGRLRRQYYDFLGVKMREIEEQKTSRRYYHGAQWTDEELKQLRRRRQPPVFSNRIVRKLDAVVGLVERLRQDPKAFPRTPMGQDGADIATAVLRYALDKVDWKSKAPRVARFAAIDGISGIELDLQTGDHGDPDIDIHIVYADTFFYDPRSFDDGFTDCRYMGVSKWVDVDQAKEMFPEQSEELDSLVESGTDLTVNADREITWVNTSAKKVRLIDHWYINKGQWYWCIYVGSTVLMQGISPYLDERNKTFPKFLMFSTAVDHDADRYGFVRNLKGPQDEINHRRSKALHILNSRRVVSEKGAVDDVEKARIEWARPDGWVERNPGKEMAPENTNPDFQGQLNMLQEAKNEIENFGPNPALIGAGIENASGRAISLLQQAGIAELGPYIISFRTWKIRVYRAIWNIVQRYWTAERWVRVTDDNDLAQFIQLNGVGLDQFGQPAIVNAVGALDVDIILDEGPDNVNMMADAYDTLTALAQAGQKIPPQVLIELAPLQNSVKKHLLQVMAQAMADPAKQVAQQVALQGEAAKADRTKSETMKNYADATKTLHDAHVDNRAQGLQEATAVASGQLPLPLTQPSAAPMPMPAMPPTPSVDVQPQLPTAPPPMVPPGPSSPAPPIGAMAPSAPPPAPIALSLDANRAMAEAMGQFMPQIAAGQDRNSQILLQTSQAMAEASQAMAQSTHAMAASIEALARSMNEFARVTAADTELLRDPRTGRAVGARKVVN